MQETRKTTLKMDGQHKRKHRLWLEKLKEIVKDRNKWHRLVEEKTRNRERTNIKRQKGKAMANHPWT